MTDKLTEVKVGVEMTPEQKAELAKSNAEATELAHKLAAERMAQDFANGGNERPVTQVVAESILDKIKALPPEA